MVDYEEQAKRLLQDRDAVKSGVGSKSKEEKDGIAALAARLPNLEGQAAINAAVEEEAANIVSGQPLLLTPCCIQRHSSHCLLTPCCIQRHSPDAVPYAALPQPALTTQTLCEHPQKAAQAARAAKSGMSSRRASSTGQVRHSLLPP
jgi:hypothetical protein